MVASGTYWHRVDTVSTSWCVTVSLGPKGLLPGYAFFVSPYCPGTLWPLARMRKTAVISFKVCQSGTLRRVVWYLECSSLHLVVQASSAMARRMPPDGLCLFHAVRYAQNPLAYEAVAAAANGMLVGDGSTGLYAAAEELRQDLITWPSRVTRCLAGVESSLRPRRVPSGCLTAAGD